ncbi:MAG: HPF/RaiA family ribosome-associated protein [Phycisphaerae bacterium]|jgi:hypothetical protein
MADHPPVTIAFEGLAESDAVQTAAVRHARSLERFCDRILGCTIVISRPHHHGRHGDLFSVRIRLSVPGRDIVTSHEHRWNHAHEDVFVALRDAFVATRRQLEDHVRIMRGDVKHHATALTESEEAS